MQISIKYIEGEGSLDIVPIADLRTIVNDPERWFDPGAKAILGDAYDIALKLGNQHIHSDHILQAMLGPNGFNEITMTKKPGRRLTEDKVRILSRGNQDMGYGRCFEGYSDTHQDTVAAFFSAAALRI